MGDPLLDLVNGASTTRIDLSGMATPDVDPLLSIVNPIGSPSAQAVDKPVSSSAEPISRIEKLLKGMRDPIDGGAQLLTHILPKGVVDAGNAANNWLADKTGLVSKLPDGGVDQQVKQDEDQYQSRRKAQGESGFDGYRMLGNVASPANAAIGYASTLPKVASLAGRVGFGALEGAGTAALNPVTSEDYWKDKGLQVGSGVLAGGAVAPLTSGVARLISPNASKNADLALLKQEGVSPTIGQTLGGWANTLEEKAQSLPLVGDMIANARGNARNQFNEAAINRATAPIGQKVEGVGSSAIQDAGDRITEAYNTAKNSLGGFKIDPQANSELSNLRLMATSGLEGRERKTVNSYFKDYLSRPSLTADSFKELDSKLTSDIAKFGAGDAYQQKVADALKEVQSIVTNNAKRANPEAAAALDAADSAWANLVRVEGASVGAKSTNGVFTPGQLLTAVRGADKSVRDRATARGTALMQDLATSGQNVLGNKVPDSGTAGRLGMGVLGAALYAQPLITGTALAGGLAAYTPMMQSLLRGAVSNRGLLADPIAESLKKSTPMLVPGITQMGLGLLN